MSEELSPRPQPSPEGDEAVSDRLPVSPHEPATGPPGPAPAPGSASADVSSVDRRSFFRTFSRQTVTTVAQVAGMAGAVQRGATSAVVNAVGIGLGNPSQNVARFAPVETDHRLDDEEAASVGAAAATDGPRFRSPYRLADGTLYVLDQRLLPDRFEEIACRRAADVAFQMRMLAVNGGPLLGQLAAYGLALSAADARGWVAGRRQAELRRATQLLTYARPAAHPVRAALARMDARVAELAAAEPAPRGASPAGAEPQASPGDAIADALMAEADQIATQAAIDHAAIARATAELLRPEAGAPLRLLIVGDPGLMTTGQVGTGIAALQLLAQSGVDLKVFVAEGRPRLDGARLAAWELRLAGIDHTIVGDSAVGWLLATEPLDAVLLGAEWIAPNGDLVATIGGRPIVELAALGLLDGHAAPVYVLAPSVTIATEPFAGTSIPAENRPGRELSADHGAAGHRGTNAVNPGVELIPNERVRAFVTERGVHRAPFATSLPSPRVWQPVA